VRWGRGDAPLRRAGERAEFGAVDGEDPRLQERLYQGEDALVTDSAAHPVHQGRVVDRVERNPDSLPVSRTLHRGGCQFTARPARQYRRRPPSSPVPHPTLVYRGAAVLAADVLALGVGVLTC
jgi:hypothetical protein